MRKLLLAILLLLGITSVAQELPKGELIHSLYLPILQQDGISPGGYNRVTSVGVYGFIPNGINLPNYTVTFKFYTIEPGGYCILREITAENARVHHNFKGGEPWTEQRFYYDLIQGVTIYYILYVNLSEVRYLDSRSNIHSYKKLDYLYRRNTQDYYGILDTINV